MMIFALSWAPIQLMLVCRSLHLCSMRSGPEVMLQIVFQVLAYMNSCVNPILYAFLSENFRKEFRKAILCHLIGFPLSAPSAGGGQTGGGASTAPIELRTVQAEPPGSRRCSSAQV